MERDVQEEDAIEEEAPDWRMLSKFTKGLGSQVHGTTAEAFIPRRGEKDFEPVDALAPTQLKVLQESRQALFAALSAGIRGHSSRDHVRCVWSHYSGRLSQRDQRPITLPPYVDGVAKGVLFSSIGRWSRERKRLELAPEELLYLIERGTVECWSTDDLSDGHPSVPMSVQRAWAEIIGTSQLSLERYQVYAYLKRLGYIVLRKEHVDSIWRSQAHPTPQPTIFSLRSFLGNLGSLLCRPFTKFSHWLRQLWTPESSIGKTLTQLAATNHSLIHCRRWKNYESIFKASRIIPSGPKICLPRTPRTCERAGDNEGYEVFYYVYKPNNRFPKSAPPAPDFQVCVVNSEKMAIPDISITSNLLDTVRGPAAPAYPPTAKSPPPRPATDPSPPTRRLGPLSMITRFLPSGWFANRAKPKKVFRQNVFTKLKRGERDVLLAVVDHGIISFLKFLETDFAGSPLVGAQSSI